MSTYTTITKATLPAGEYVVGDPCYAIPEHRWAEWLEAADYTNQRHILVAELDGVPAVGVGTAFGDGFYHDQDGRAYPVDAGLIGLVPTSLAVGDHSVVVTFDKPVECWYDDGTIHLGDIVIETDEDLDDEDDDYLDEYDDEDDNEESW